MSVLVTQSWVEAEITKGRLEAEGIPVHLKGVGEGPYPAGPNQLFVPSTFEAQARRVLGEIASGSLALQDSDDDAAKTPPTRDGGD